MALEKGAVVDGIVTGITNFGAFVELPENKVGLIHISEVSNVFVKDVHDFLTVKQKVTVKVVSIDEKGKIGLSMKALMPPAEQKNEHGGEGSLKAVNSKAANRVNIMVIENQEKDVLAGNASSKAAQVVQVVRRDR